MILPTLSFRRILGLLALFYAATAVLYFNYFCLVESCAFGPVFNGAIATVWPMALIGDPFRTGLIVVSGLATAALIEPRVTEVGN
jgi:hypothetical protein